MEKLNERAIKRVEQLEAIVKTQNKLIAILMDTLGIK